MEEKPLIILPISLGLILQRDNKKKQIFSDECFCTRLAFYLPVVSWTLIMSFTVHAQLFLASGLCVCKCVCIVTCIGSLYG